MELSATAALPHPALQPLLAQALDAMAIGAMLTDTGGRIIWVNQAFCHMTGHARDEVIGQSPSILKSGQQDEQFYRHLWDQVLAGNIWQGRIVEARKDGSTYTAEEIITPLRDASGAITHFFATHQDVTQRELAHARDRFLAQHDVLTGLPNRVMLHDIVHRAISHASRTQQLVAVMFIDLDGFKPVNDQFGHAVGDQLLAAVAERLRSVVRQSDTVARVGGDEFVALAVGVENREGASALAGKLLASLSAPFMVRSKRISIGASVGIAIFPTDGTDGDALINKADQAMYHAKLTGGHGHHFFASAHGGAAVAHHTPPPRELQ
jgi:diguanylate cyclase